MPPPPHAEQVAVGVEGLLDALAIAGRVAGAIEEAVVGDPVEAFAEDRLAVDFHHELAADGVGGGIELEVRRPMRAVDGIHHLAVASMSSKSTE